MARTGLYPDIHGHKVMALRPTTRVQNVTFSGTSAISTVFQVVNQNTTYTESTTSNASSPPGCTHVRLCATADCYVVFGAGVTATVATGMFLPSGVPEYFPVDTGDQIAVIQSSSGGTLNIVEMS